MHRTQRRRRNATEPKSKSNISEEFKMAVEKRHSHSSQSELTLVGRFRWVLQKKNNMTQLKIQLQEKNDSLYRNAPESALMPMQMNVIIRSLSQLEKQENLDGLITRLNVVIQHGSPGFEESPSYAGFKLLHDIAEMKALDRESKPVDEDEGERLVNLHLDDFEFNGTPEQIGNQMSAPALWKSEQKAVFVEFKSYRNDSGQNVNAIRNNVLGLGRLLKDRRAASRLGAMWCKGLFDTEHGLIGFVYPLPGYLASADWKTHRPHRLSSSFKGFPQRSLGWRFKLARDLLRSLLLIHASGWLHKNIRPESILFLKANSRTSSGTTETRRRRIDMSKTYLLGYNNSRPRLDDDFDDEEEYTTTEFDSDIDTQGRTAATRPATTPLDIYHHPDKRANPNIHYQPVHDLYSLGLVLLEIGLWKPLTSILEEHHIPSQTEDRPDFAAPVRKLHASCGEIYEAAVRALLSMKTRADRDGKRIQMEQAARIYAELARCCA